MPSSSGHEKFNARRIAEAFPSAARARGERYFDEERVVLLSLDSREVIARIRDTEDCVVVIRTRARDERGAVVELEVACTCAPFVRDAERCKHLWASLLAVEGGSVLSSVMAAPRSVVVSLRDKATLDLIADLARLPPPPKDYVPPISDVHLEVQSAHALVEDSAAARDLALPTARAPAAPPGWRDWLAHAVSEVASERIPSALDRRHRHELSYAIDLRDARRKGSLTVAVCERTAGPSTPNARPQPVRLTQSGILALADPLDRTILETIALAPPGARASYEQAFSEPLLGPTFAAPMAGLWPDLMVPLARGRRCQVTFAEGTPSSTLVADENGPFQIVIVVGHDDAGRSHLRVRAELRRGAEIVDLSHLTVIFAARVAFLGPRAIQTTGDVPFAWISMLRAQPNATLLVPSDERDELLRALASTCPAGSLEISGFTFDDLPPPLLVRVRLCTSDREVRWDRSRPFDADVTFEYGGARASFRDGGDLVVDVARTKIVKRDRAAENDALEELARVGFQLAGGRGARGRLTLAVARLAEAVSALAADRFVIEADGVLVRRASSTSFSVTSGIDWFEIEGVVEFDGIVTPMPEILAAIARGERTVRLGDGKVGILPEEFLARLERLRTVAGKKDSLRFGRAQIALVEAMVADDRIPVSWQGPLAALRERLALLADGIAPAATPPGFCGELRTYQASGVAWLAALEEVGLSGCLADDMGLGKTVQVVAHLLARKRAGRAKGPSIVVAPRSVVYNWIEEARRFAPDLSVAEHERGRAAGDAEIIVTSYGLLRHDIAALSRVDFDYVILDEAHTIKNPHAATTKAARLLRARHRLALTGTPVENHLGELGSLFDFLDPGMLASLHKASSKGRRFDPGTASRLGRGLRPFLLRRKKSEVLGELPPRIEQTIHCVLGKEQRETYDRLKEHYRTTLLARVRTEGVAKNTVHVLEALLRLRQVACHPGLVDRSAERDASAKLDALLEHLETIVAEEKKALVFSQFTSLLDLVGAALDDRGITFERLDGSTRDRRERVERFQTDDGCAVFLVSLKAGGVGLNLTAAEYVFLLDPWWNPAAEAQAIDRAHRIGQARTVVAYRLLAQDTIEERVAELQEKKRALVASLFAGAESTSLGSLSADDVDALLS